MLKPQDIFVLLKLAVRLRENIVPNFRNLEEFLIHGLKYVFWAEQGEMTRGMPTAYAAPPLAELLVSTAAEPPPVWPDPDGEVRGIAFRPLRKILQDRPKKDTYSSVNMAASIRSRFFRTALESDVLSPTPHLFPDTITAGGF